MERVTVGQFLDDWLENTAKPALRPSTFRSYESYVRLHLKPTIGKLALVRLEPADVQRMMRAQLDSGLSPRTVAYIRAILRRALGQAEKWGQVGRNVAKLVDPPRAVHRRIEALDHDKARAMVDALREDRLFAMYFTALTMGLRSGELRGLRWEDVDLENRLLHVRQALQRVEGKLTLVPTKTERSRRSLPLPAVVVTALEGHRERQEFERLLVGQRWQSTGFVFTTSVGTPIDGSSAVHRFQALLEAKGFEPIRLHDLRHACATFLLSQGVELRVVMEVLGHSGIALTANTYAHVLPTVSRDAMDRMGQLFPLPS